MNKVLTEMNPEEFGINDWDAYICAEKGRILDKRK